MSYNLAVELLTISPSLTWILLKMSCAGVVSTVPSGSPLCNDTILILVSEWLNAADFVSFDVVNQSNRNIKLIWLRAIRSLPDIIAMRGLSYTHSRIRWLIDRGFRTSSMRLARSLTDRLTDATFEGFCLPGLESVAVEDGSDVTDDSIKVITKGCVNLRSIEIASCPGVTWRSLVTLGRNCAGLTSLNISNYDGVIDKGIIALAEGCIHLQSIDIGYCDKLSNASLAVES